MTKKGLIWILALIIFSMSAYGAVTDDILARYNFTNDALDQEHDYNWTINGAPTHTANCYGGAGCYDFNPVNDYLKLDGDNYPQFTEYTMMFWIQPTDDGTNDYFMDFFKDNGIEVLYYAATTNVLTNFHDTACPGTWDAGVSTGALTSGKWQQVIFWWNGTHKQAYLNGTASALLASSVLDDCNGNDVLAGRSTPTGAYNGNLSDTVIWNRSLTTSELNEIINKTYNEFISTGAGTSIRFTAIDDWNSTGISSFAVNVSYTNGTLAQYSTTNGTIIINDAGNPGTINATFWNVTDYFNLTFYNQVITVNATNTIQASMYQAVVCLNASSKVNEAWVTPDNFTIDSTTQASCFNLTAETHNVQAQLAGWYPQNQSFTITPLQNATLTVQNMSYANLTIYAIDGTTNESLTGYDIVIGSIANPFYKETFTGVTNHSIYLINDTFNTTITMPGYATTTSYANITVNGHTNYTFTLYRANSVTITIRDEITNNLITDNVTVRWTNNITTWENVTSTGHLFVANLTPSNYTLLFYSSNYSTRTYTITVGNLSTQFLTAYMISSAYSTIFTVKDKDTGDVMPDVSFTMSKLVNSTWTTVESKYSDITGKIQVYYDPIGNYRFYLAKTDYEDLIFYLNPVLFSTYDVFMVKSSLLNYSVDYDDIAVVYSPYSFNNNDNTTFNFLISSPDGLLTDYGITVTYPGGSGSASGVNAIGEQLSVWVNITNATRWDTVKLEYNYTTSISGTRTFTQYLSINTNATASENTWLANKDRTFGMGLFERVLIATIIVIFCVGIASLVGQALPGIALGLFVYGFLVFIGFLPLWAILPSMLIGVLFLVWKSGGY